MAVSNQDVTRWQQRSHRALGEFLAHAQKASLPSLAWTIASGTGALVGEATGLTSTPTEQRAAVGAWAKYLGVNITERTGRDGVIHLNAHFKWSRDEFVGGAIRADIFPTLDEEGEL
ncbi:hypothetical protein [Streptomyces sp. DW26H14]|uniref:hypothetical protein n=1 Tax=Streptomyces sp. DW26H14 TaxID=3435395 RepID=UPI00403D676F